MAVERGPTARKPPRGRPPGLSSLAVVRVLPAVRAELLQVKTVRVVAPVLPRDVVPVLAHLTRHSDLRTNVGGGHGVSLFLYRLLNGQAPRSRVALPFGRAPPLHGRPCTWPPSPMEPGRPAP